MQMALWLIYLMFGGPNPQVNGGFPDDPNTARANGGIPDDPTNTVRANGALEDED